MVSKLCAKEKALAFDEPIEFKGVQFYPVGLEYLYEFYISCEVLKIKQERIKNKTLIKMPYLWFLFYTCHNYEIVNEPRFAANLHLVYALFEMITKQNDIDFAYLYDNEGNLKKCNLVISGVEFNYKDFEKIRAIIFEQNGIDWNNKFVHPDAEEALKEYQELINKKSSYISPSLEDLIDLVAMYLHMPTKEIRSFSIRKFNNLVRRMSSFEEYKLLRGAELGGFVTFKKPVRHWLTGLEKQDEFKDVNINYQNSEFLKI